MQFTVRFLGDEVVGRAHEAEQQPDDQQVGVHHPRHVERQQREQEVAHHVLQPHDQTEEDLTDEQDQCKHEVGFGDRLRLEFEMRVNDAHLVALL